jgi:hypothetical protein
MESTLRAQIAEVLATKGEGEPRFLPLLTLDSGARYGLDAELRWILAAAEGVAVVAIDNDNVHLLHEAIEWRRERFDDAIAKAARLNGLPEDDVVDAFPVAGLIRAVLDKRISYLTRLALAWLRPSELRELRTEILAVSKDAYMPAPVRGLAERLVVAV